MTRSRLCVLLVAFLLGAATLAAVPVIGSLGAARVPLGCSWLRREPVARWRGQLVGRHEVVEAAGPRAGHPRLRLHPAGFGRRDRRPSPRVDLDVLELGPGRTPHPPPRHGAVRLGRPEPGPLDHQAGLVIEVDGATLGGGGLLHVIGTLDIHWSSTGSRAVLTTRPEESSYAGPRGSWRSATRGSWTSAVATRSGCPRSTSSTCTGGLA